jgi:hypothetical protein
LPKNPNVGLACRRAKFPSLLIGRCFRGKVTEFTPGHVLFLKTEAAQPVQYRFSKNVTYVTSDGRVIEASKIRKDSKVRVHYIKQGDDMLVDKVIVSDRD